MGKVLTLGTFGDNIQLKVGKGSTIGPWHVEMTDDEEEPFDLTEYLVRGSVVVCRDGVVVLEKDFVVEFGDPDEDDIISTFDFYIDEEDAAELIAEICSEDGCVSCTWSMVREEDFGSHFIFPLYYGDVVFNHGECC